MNSRAWARPFCPTVASSTSSVSCGAPAISREATRANLLELLHQVGARVQPACGIHEDHVAAAGTARRERVEHDGGRIGAFARAHHVHAGPIGPHLQLIDRGGAKRVGRADERRLALALQLVRELADRRSLAGAVHADDEDHPRRHPAAAAQPGRDPPRGARGRSPRARAAAATRRAAAVGRRPRRSASTRTRPTSAINSTSSRLSSVSGSIVRVRCSGASLPRTRSSKRSAICCAVRVSPCFSLSNNPMTLSCPQLRSAFWRRPINSRSADGGSLRPDSTCAICSVIGSSMPCRAPERQRGFGRPHALGHHLRAGHDLGQRAAARELGADVPVPAEPAGARQDEVAEPGQARQRLALAAHGHRQPRELGEPARDERGQRVVPLAQAFDHAGRNGDGVLQRPADLHANHIRRAVQPQERGPELRLHVLDRRRRRRADDHGRRQPAGELDGEARPREHRHLARRRQLRREHLASSAAANAASMPLTALTTSAPGAACGAIWRATPRTPCEGTATTTTDAVAQRRRQDHPSATRPVGKTMSGR